MKKVHEWYDDALGLTKRVHAKAQKYWIKPKSKLYLLKSEIKKSTNSTNYTKASFCTDKSKIYLLKS